MTKRQKLQQNLKLIIMSKRSFAEISTAEALILLSKSNKRQKVEQIKMLAKKRTFKKRKRQSFNSRVQRVVDRNIETKEVIDNVAQTDILGTPMFIEPTSLSQGAADAQRIGVEIRPTYLELKICFALDSTATEPFVRVIVAQSREGALVVGDFPTAYGSSPDYDQLNV